MKKFIKEVANVKPSERQMNWFDMEFYAFVHFVEKEFGSPLHTTTEKKENCLSAQAQYTINFGRAVSRDELKYVVIEEDIAQGQRIERFCYCGKG